jgi:sphingomyelin phosphodiesterase
VLGCLACRTYLASLIRDRRNGATQEELASSAVNMCGVVTPFTSEVCQGVVNLNVEALVYILDARPSLTATNICALVLQGECGTLDQSFSFTVNVNQGPAITQSKSVAVSRSPNDLKIVHLTDLHYDEHYMEGGLGNCINPVCCRRADGVPSNPADRAGFWGDYRVIFLKHIKIFLL